MGQQMLNIDSIKQPQMREQVHNNLENKRQGSGLNEMLFVQNRLRMPNYLTMNRAKPFFVKPNSIA